MPLSKTRRFRRWNWRQSSPTRLRQTLPQRFGQSRNVGARRFHCHSTVTPRFGLQRSLLGKILVVSYAFLLNPRQRTLNWHRASFDWANLCGRLPRTRCRSGASFRGARVMRVSRDNCPDRPLCGLFSRPHKMSTRLSTYECWMPALQSTALLLRNTF